MVCVARVLLCEKPGYLCNSGVISLVSFKQLLGCLTTENIQIVSDSTERAKSQWRTYACERDIK